LKFVIKELKNLDENKKIKRGGSKNGERKVWVSGSWL
jgi:hypothetical protein